ncbi:unnamed protein product [Withania somnifera]
MTLERKVLERTSYSYYGCKEEKLLTNANDSLSEEEIARIREEYNDAKEKFLKIPDALKQMPKMNPKGIYVNKNIRLDSIQVYGFDYGYALAHYSSNLQSLIYDLAKQHLLSHEEVDEMYGTRHIGCDQARELVCLMDFFCFSEACLIGDIVQHFVDAKLEFDARYIYEDVNRAIQFVHNSGLVHRGILSDPPRNLVKNDQLLRFLRLLKDKGKKLFLLTNSPFYFVDGGMRFMLQDSLGQQGSWWELFDVVIAKANKPDFYKSDHPFRFGYILGITLFSDLRGPSKVGWRTAAIIHELKNDNAYRFEQAKFHIILELLGRLHATVPSSVTSEAYKSLLRELNEERQKTRYKMKGMFNKSFGATLLTDTGQESAFAYHIHQYADIYTSKPESFLYYPPEAWLHVPFDIKIMRHHLKVSSNLFRS